MPIQPLTEIPLDPLLASLPKADLHCHQEEIPRLARILAHRRGRTPFDWRCYARRLMDTVSPGIARLEALFAPDADLDLGDGPTHTSEQIVAKIVDALAEGAADGARLVELRFGVASQAMQHPDFMALFREAERQVQARYPGLVAEAIGFLNLRSDLEQQRLTNQYLDQCLEMASQGLAGVDFLVSPYHREADPELWQTAYRMAERAAAAGLGITVHAGEFSTANIAAALRIPGLKRLGHGVYAADPRLLDQLLRSGVTVECSLSCNVVLGAVSSYENHPLSQFVAAGVPVTLNTDDPVRVWTTIGREYALATALGFTPATLLGFTRNAIRASFTTADRRQALLAELAQWATNNLSPT